MKVYWTDDLNEGIRCIDFNKVDWKTAEFPVESGPGFIDLSRVLPAF